MNVIQSQICAWKQPPSILPTSQMQICSQVYTFWLEGLKRRSSYSSEVGNVVPFCLNMPVDISLAASQVPTSQLILILILLFQTDTNGCCCFPKQSSSSRYRLYAQECFRASPKAHRNLWNIIMDAG